MLSTQHHNVVAFQPSLLSKIVLRHLLLTSPLLNTNSGNVLFGQANLGRHVGQSGLIKSERCQDDVMTPHVTTEPRPGTA